MKKIGKLTGYVPSGQYIAVENVPFKQALPLKLRNYVSTKGGKSNSAVCIQEMSILFACLKKNEFVENFCPKEIASFQKCYNDSVKEKKIEEEREKQGVLVPGQKRLSIKQLNELMKRYPSS